jgi:murein DD-endopeptidase MepM/ murein hydrolase activator NlpD
VTRKPGDPVSAGQQVGKVGFSGSVYTIHTHFQLQGGPDYFAEGLPSYFLNASRVGVPTAARALIRIDSGDLVVGR